MLTLFNHPTSSNARQYDLSTLNEFIDWVNKSPLPESTRLDCIKILETMRWIKVNPEQLREFIDNKEQCLSQLPQRDQANGVVRDHLGTSLHFNSYQWCQLINLSSDPNTIPSEDLKKLLQNKPSYALFDNTLYFVNPDASLMQLAFEAKNIAKLKKIFPAVKDVPQEGAKENSEIITSLASHTVQTPGECAVHDLTEIVTTFENTFQKLQAANNTLGLMSFIAKCDYDKDRGCLEARIEKAMLCAGTIAATVGNCSQLDDLLQVCQLLHFLDLERDTYNFVMASEFFSPFYGQRVSYQQQEQILTQDLIFTAMEELLSYTRLNQEELTAEISRKTTDFQQWQATWQAEARANEARTFQNLIKNAEVVIGHTSMVQYRFRNQGNADQLSQWLRGCKSLADYGIDRCQTKQELRGTETEYVVRLMPLQRDVLVNGETSASVVATVPLVTQAQAVPATTPITNEMVQRLYELLNIHRDGNNRTAFIRVINNAPVEAIDRVLQKGYWDIWDFHNFLTQILVHWRDDQAIQALVKKASAEALNNALIRSGFTKCWPYIIDLSSETVLEFILKSSSSNDLNSALSWTWYLFKRSHTVLSIAAFKHNSIVFQAVINKASVEAIDKALPISDGDYNGNALYLAAANQDSIAFQALVNKASIKAIDASLVIPNNKGQTPLHIAALNQDSAGFQALVHKASPKVMNKVLPIKDNKGYTALYYAIEKQNSAAMRALIDKASPEVIRQALLIKNDIDIPLDWMAAQLSFVNNITELEHWIVLLLKISGKLSSWPVDKAFTDQETLVNEIANIEDDIFLQLATKIMQYWTILSQITTPIAPSLTVTSSEGKTSPLHVNPIQLSNGDSALLTDDNLANTIRTHGLASKAEFYMLQTSCVKGHPEAGSLRHVLGFMEQYDTLQPALKPSILAISKELQNGNLLMKTFSGWQPQAWPDFIKQLKTPEQRVPLRKPLGTTVTSHKFHHLTGEITEYSKGPKVKPHHATHAKKQSATLISTEKNTPLFQAHQPDTLLVGVALRADPNLTPGVYDPRRAKVKALLFTDAGTYGRQWRGSLAEVTQYAQKAKNYTSLEEFKEAIKQNTTQHNEVLVEPSKESLIGIVIGRDNSKARKLARQFQKDIRTHLGKDLPIISYDATKKAFIEDLDLCEATKKTKDLIAEKELLLNTPRVIVRSGV